MSNRRPSRRRSAGTIAAYRAAAVGRGFRVENARHGLHARFSAAGVEVSSENDRLTLVLRAYGYGEALTLALAVGGTLAPRVDAGRDGLTFASSSLRYGGLFATDADGRDVPTWLELDGRTLLLRVDDGQARYPLTIDPFVQQAYLKASNTGAGDSFGVSVAVSGDTIVVGAPGEDSDATGVDGDQTNNDATDAGAAYVFVQLPTLQGQVQERRLADLCSQPVFADQGKSVTIVGSDGAAASRGLDRAQEASGGNAVVTEVRHLDDGRVEVVMELPDTAAEAAREQLNSEPGVTVVDRGFTFTQNFSESGSIYGTAVAAYPASTWTGSIFACGGSTVSETLEPDGWRVSASGNTCGSGANAQTTPWLPAGALDGEIMNAFDARFDLTWGDTPTPAATSQLAQTNAQ